MRIPVAAHFFRTVACLNIVLMTTGCATCQWVTAHRELLPPPRSSRPPLVVDLDDTIVPSPNGPIYAVAPVGHPPNAYPGAICALQRLNARYRLVMLTARPAIVLPGTLLWLERIGLPRTPVVFPTSLLIGERTRAHYKLCVLRALEARGYTIAWGIGDKPGDVGAYLLAGSRAAQVVQHPCDADRMRRSDVQILLATDAWTQFERMLR